MKKTLSAIRVQKCKSFTISHQHKCKVYSAGNVVEIITVKKPPSSIISKYRRLDKDSCIDLETGEITRYQKSSKRLDNHSGLRKTFGDLRRIINANFIGDDRSELHIVLTYCYNESDYTKAAKDFSRFWARFMYHYPGCEYIRILEPQNSGRWHVHLLVKKMGGNSLYVDYDQLRSLWGLGLIHVSKMPSADNFGAYFTAIFCDYDVFENAECQERDPKAWKAIVKGARFRFYPPSFRFFSCSKGIIRPRAMSMSYGEARNLVSNSKEVYSYTKQIVAENELGNIMELNAVQYQQFNSQRNQPCEVPAFASRISEEKNLVEEKIL